MSKNKTPVASFLAEHPQPSTRKCLTCARKDLLPLIDEFAALVKSGKTNASWNYFHSKFLVAKHGYTPGYPALMNHVRGCIK